VVGDAGPELDGDGVGEVGEVEGDAVADPDVGLGPGVPLVPGDAHPAIRVAATMRRVHWRMGVGRYRATHGSPPPAPTTGRLDPVTASPDALLAGWCAAVAAARRSDAAGHPDTHNADADAAAGRELLACWAEPHRRYHTCQHLAAVLSTVDAHQAEAGHPATVRLAVWFHDAVYDPRRADNEDASARLAETVLASLAIPVDTVAEVARLVRLTARHDPAPEDRDGQLLCDADLAILAAPEPEYDTHAAQVRQEYCHVEEQAFRAGRAAVLAALLGHATLFHRPALRDKWESQARINLAREISILTTPPSSRNALHS
jgi:predicted metal-dependent HD superfamily phosphohydrolase